MILRTLRVLWAIAAPMAFLIACGLFSLSPYPENLTQVTEIQDFSSGISTAAAQGFNLYSVSAGGFEFVVLFTDSSTDSGAPHLVVMDSRLNVQNTFTLGDLNALAGSFHGSVALRDCNSRVAVGNILFNPSSSGLTFWGTQPVDLREPTLMIMTNPLFPWIEANFRTNAGNLDYDEYDPSWVTTSTPSDFLIGTPAPAPSSPLRVAAAFTDPESTTADVVLVFSDDFSNTHYFLPVTKSDVDFHFPALGAGSIFGAYPSYAVKTDLASSSIAYSRDGMMAYNFRSQSIEHFTLGSPGTVDAMPFRNWNGGMRLACQISGDSVYVWDPQRRTVIRYAKWW